MHEDSAIELATFPRGGRIFCVASAGCTAIALAARGDDVTAVDINAAQVKYVRRRLAGGPRAHGIVDAVLAAGRRLLPLVGVRADAVRRFLLLSDPRAQAEAWRALDTPRFGMLMRAALSERVLAMTPVRMFRDVLPPRFGAVIRGRLARGVARHPNRTNVYLWRLLLGEDPPGYAEPRAVAPVTLVHADALAFLERQRPASFDGFALSNIADGADAAFGDRLLRAVARTARPGARYVLRSFAAPRDEDADANARRDRSHLWGRVILADAR
jgi:SAM-dependent methyltransferase